MQSSPVHCYFFPPTLIYVPPQHAACVLGYVLPTTDMSRTIPQKPVTCGSYNYRWELSNVLAEISKSNIRVLVPHFLHYSNISVAV
jgi:hypothetical protein